MIPREHLRELSELNSTTGCAITFYYQPQTPQNKAHTGESILVKDLVQQALRKAEQSGNHLYLRNDLRRLLEKSDEFHNNHSRGKAIFACEEQGIWREYDLPALLPRSELIVNSRFHLQPLAMAVTLPSSVSLKDKLLQHSRVVA